ncbi:MAG: GNAT family N-acetyltransferase [Prevotella sp.]|nr:GNAT family N-acetyltransferase [Prevotella sp.]
MGFLADKCTFRLLTRELIATCKPFSCGYDDLDEYFLKDSPLWADQMYGKTYCFVLRDDPQTIVCAFSLSNETIRVDLLPNSQKKRFLKEIPKEKRMRRYPAVLIGRLGVDIRFANNGIGTELMQILKFWFVEPDNKAAVRYLAVDALNNSRTLNYYEKNGFAYLFKEEEQEAISSRMKLPLKTRYMYFDLIEVIRK